MLIASLISLIASLIRFVHHSIQRLCAGDAHRTTAALCNGRLASRVLLRYDAH